MIVKKYSDPYIMNVKAELLGLKASLKYRETLQYSYKKEFSNAQRNVGNGSQPGKIMAMIQWNSAYISRILDDITYLKNRLRYLYEQERKILYMAEGRKRED